MNKYYINNGKNNLWLIITEEALNIIKKNRKLYKSLNVLPVIKD